MFSVNRGGGPQDKRSSNRGGIRKAMTDIELRCTPIRKGRMYGLAEEKSRRLTDMELRCTPIRKARMYGFPKENHGF